MSAMETVRVVGGDGECDRYVPCLSKGLLSGWWIIDKRFWDTILRRYFLLLISMMNIISLKHMRCFECVGWWVILCWGGKLASISSV